MPPKFKIVHGREPLSRKLENPIFKTLKLHYQAGIYEFRDISIQPNDINWKTDVIFLIITRWTSVDLRNYFRLMLKNDAGRTKLTYKTIFLFNYDDSATNEEVRIISEENKKHKDMLVWFPCSYFIFQLGSFNNFSSL